MPYRSSLTAHHESAVSAAISSIRAGELAIELAHIRRMAEQARADLNLASAALAERVRVAEDEPGLRSAGLLGGIAFLLAKKSITKDPTEKRRELRDVAEAQSFVKITEVLAATLAAHESGLESELDRRPSTAGGSTAQAPIAVAYANLEGFERAAALAVELTTRAERAASLAADAHKAAVIAALTGIESFEVDPVFHSAMCETQRTRGQGMILLASVAAIEHPQSKSCSDALEIALDELTTGESAPDQEWRNRVSSFRDRCVMVERQIKTVVAVCERQLQAQATAE